MRDRPLFLEAAMVRAVLDGHKTQVRLPILGAPNDPDWHCDKTSRGLMFVATPGAPSMPVQLPCRVGGRLWVREDWQFHSRASDVLTIVYRATINRSWTETHELFPTRPTGGLVPRPFQSGWRSAALMPRWASRLTLLVTDVRVQKLQSISREDVVAEGITERDGHPIGDVVAGWHEPFAQRYASAAWKANPWVAAISFEVIEKRLDTRPPAREAAHG